MQKSSITGVDDEEKKAILQRLEDIWMSDNWLPSKAANIVRVAMSCSTDSV